MKNLEDTSKGVKNESKYKKYFKIYMLCSVIRRNTDTGKLCGAICIWLYVWYKDRDELPELSCDSEE